MRRIRPSLIIGCILLAAAALLFWWSRPVKVDLAAYAPSSSLLYLESDSPTSILNTITSTRAWSVLAPEMGASTEPFRTGLTQRFVRWTGIGSTASVVLLRSQIAVVVTGLVTTEEGDSLRVKPQAVLVVETHTSEYRIRGFVEGTLQQFANRTFINPSFSRINRDGTEFMEWTSKDGQRQIVAVIHGTVVLVGNARSAVEACLTALTTGDSLRADERLKRLRSRMQADTALAFGYVPAQNSPRLLSVGLPLLMGRAPDVDFQNAIAASATKLIGALAWSCKPYADGVEDHYLVSIQPDVGRQLEISFSKAADESLGEYLPGDTVSVTRYRFQNSLNAWRGLRTAVSSHIDALSAVFFSSVLKTALLSYGISDPEEFLRHIEGEVVTIRLDEGGDHLLLLGSIRDREAFQTSVKTALGLTSQQHAPPDYYLISRVEGDMALSLVGNRLVIGTAADVRRYIASQPTDDIQLSKRMNVYLVPSSAQVVTQTDDSSRLRAFVEAVTTMNRNDGKLSPEVDQKIAALPFAVTETLVTGQEIERLTRSPLGQFSFISSLVVPERTEPNSPVPLSR